MLWGDAVGSERGIRAGDQKDKKYPPEMGVGYGRKAKDLKQRDLKK